MSTTQRRKFKAEFKAMVAIAAVKEHQTMEEICKKFDIHPTQANQWKREFLGNASSLFDKQRKDLLVNDQEKLLQELYAQIGQLKVENDFLKKKLN